MQEAESFTLHESPPSRRDDTLTLPTTQSYKALPPQGPLRMPPAFHYASQGPTVPAPLSFSESYMRQQITMEHVDPHYAHAHHHDLDANISAQFGSPIIPVSTNHTFDIGSLAKNAQGIFVEPSRSESGTGLTQEMETAFQQRRISSLQEQEEQEQEQESPCTSLTESQQMRVASDSARSQLTEVAQLGDHELAGASTSVKTTVKMKRELGDLQSKIDQLQRKLSDNTTRISEYYTKIGMKLEPPPPKQEEDELLQSQSSVGGGYGGAERGKKKRKLGSLSQNSSRARLEGSRRFKTSLSESEGDLCASRRSEGNNLEVRALKRRVAQLEKVHRAYETLKVAHSELQHNFRVSESLRRQQKGIIRDLRSQLKEFKRAANHSLVLQDNLENMHPNTAPQSAKAMLSKKVVVLPQELLKATKSPRVRSTSLLQQMPRGRAIVSKIAPKKSASGIDIFRKKRASKIKIEDEDPRGDASLQYIEKPRYEEPKREKKQQQRTLSSKRRGAGAGAKLMR